MLPLLLYTALDSTLVSERVVLLALRVVAFWAERVVAFVVAVMVFEVTYF